MATYTVTLQNVSGDQVVSLSDGSNLAKLEVNPSRGPKGDGWTGVSYDTNTGRFTFTSNDGLGYVSDDITVDLDTAVAAAQAAQSGAEAAEAATELLFDQFGDQYLGPKASDPTLDNDGNPLVEGAVYFNTTDDVLKFYSGTAWVAPEVIATNAAAAAQASASAAATSESNAATSESNAATSESNAATSATNAANSASAAAASATEAQGYADSINPDNIDINGGTIDGTVIGGSTPAAGSFTTGSFTGNVSFGDNDKAIFGAGSDLQIFHDGSVSKIADSGVGNFDLQTNGASIRLMSNNGTETMGLFNQNGSVDLHYDNALKLATTSTGIDVTGTVTADGLTVDTSTGVLLEGTGTSATHKATRGTAATNNSRPVFLFDLDSTGDAADNFGPSISFTISDTAADDSELGAIGFVRDGADGSGKFVVGQDSQALGTSPQLTVATNGDISFYEDTGTTPKFFWDASAESLGIGTTTPASPLEITTTNKLGATFTGNINGEGLTVTQTDYVAGNYISLVESAFDNSGRADPNVRIGAKFDGSGSSLAFGTSNSYGSGITNTALTINPSGNVGIGTSSPDTKLEVQGPNPTIRLEDTQGGAKRLELSVDNFAIAKISATQSASQLVFETVGTERMRIDSSGNVGIGTSSPDAELHIEDATGNAVVQIESSATGFSAIFLGDVNDGDVGQIRYDHSDNSMRFGTNATAERMRIDSSGNVGIGTSSPAEPLHVQEGSSGITQRAGTVALIEGSANTKLTVASGATSTGEVLFGRNGDNDAGSVRYDHNTNSMQIDTNSNERLRIDSSGNLLVGTTSIVPQDIGDEGIVLRNNGYLIVSADGSQTRPMLVNRNTTDGEIVRFTKDGTTVGSIGTQNGSDFYITGTASDDTGLRFQTNEIVPVNDAGGNRDNAIDLGKSNIRFKDLYLSSKTKYQTSGGNQHSIGADTNDLVIRSETAGSETARFTYGGNLLVGTTDTAPASSNVDGISLRSAGHMNVSRSAGVVGYFNRRTNDGEILQFRKDGSTRGSIGVVSPDFYIGSSGGSGLFFGGSRVQPMNSLSQSDNTIDLGHPSYRWQDVYASNGTIQTSDRNEKQDIEALSDAEQRVAVAAKGLLRKYRWKDAVAEKGDAARIHFGIIAQDLQAAFEAEGLDAGRYGMFISSTWWEAEVEKTREVEQEDGTTVTETYTATETYDEPTEGATERTRMGVRYPELLAFIIAAI